MEGDGTRRGYARFRTKKKKSMTKSGDPGVKMVLGCEGKISVKGKGRALGGENDGIAEMWARGAGRLEKGCDQCRTGKKKKQHGANLMGRQGVKRVGKRGDRKLRWTPRR